MKIAISAKENKKEAEISELGGKAPFYLIFENGEQIKSISNPFLQGGGAGVSMAKMLKDEGVELVITGKVGSKMRMALESNNIKLKEETNKNVKEALEKTEK